MYAWDESESDQEEYSEITIFWKLAKEIYALGAEDCLLNQMLVLYIFYLEQLIICQASQLLSVWKLLKEF